MAKSKNTPKIKKTVPKTLIEFVESWKENGFPHYTNGLDTKYSTTQCNCDPGEYNYCRCTRIEDIEVFSTPMFFYELFEDVEEIKQEPIVHLFLSKYCFKHAVLEGTSEGGYYGEELGKVFWRNADIAHEYIEHTKGNCSEMVKQFLLEEYNGALSENVRDYIESGCDWKLISVSADKVHHSSIHHSKFTNNKSKSFTDPLNKYAGEAVGLQHYKDTNPNGNYDPKKTIGNLLKMIELYSPITVPEGNGNYKIVDGNHKFAAIKNFHKKTYEKNPYNKKTQTPGVIKTINEIDKIIDDKKVLIFVPVIT